MKLYEVFLNGFFIGVECLNREVAIGYEQKGFILKVKGDE